MATEGTVTTMDISTIISATLIEGKCSQCVAEGEKSTVHMHGGGSTTLMYFSPFYDEDGQYHHHDGNRTTQTGRCSRGHTIVVVTTGACWCGWKA